MGGLLGRCVGIFAVVVVMNGICEMDLEEGCWCIANRRGWISLPLYLP